jgi:integrase
MERAKKPEKLPTVMSKKEVSQVLAEISGTHRLMAKLLYGCGLRLMECVRLRVKDVDFDQDQIIVRGGKGMKDRSTLLPEQLRPLLSDQ